MPGRSEFPFIIDRRAIADIADAVETGEMIFAEGIQAMLQAGAPRKDIQVGLIILALQKYMQTRQVQAGFTVDFK